MSAVAGKAVSDLTVGKARSAKNLVLIPLSGNKKSKVRYILVDRAIQEGKAVVTEVDEGGNVPRLKLVNKAGEFILINDGTLLVGAKQNRIVNATILVAPNTEVTIPVSCVEAGRWNYREKVFRGGRHHSPHRMRRSHVILQDASPKTGMWYVSDQRGVWNDVGEMSQKLNAHSPTAAMDEVFEQRKESFDEYLDKLAHGDGETGMAIFIGGEFCGLELFDNPATLAAIYGKLLSGYVADALIAENGKKKVAIKDLKEKLKEILAEVREIPMEAYPAAVGVGLDERYKGNFSIGKSLSFEDDIIHFCAFSK